MPAPVRSAEQRAVALEAALRARRFRAELRVVLKAGVEDPAAIVSAAQDDARYAKLRVRWLLESLPGVGPIRAEQVMADLGIAHSRRLGGLNDRQRSLLASVVSP
ncbi:MAG: integration host factor, actinobacterial type [Candidatus Nanopelagicales bacterium]